MSVAAKTLATPSPTILESKTLDHQYKAFSAEADKWNTCKDRSLFDRVYEWCTSTIPWTPDTMHEIDRMIEDGLAPAIAPLLPTDSIHFDTFQFILSGRSTKPLPTKSRVLAQTKGNRTPKDARMKPVRKRSGMGGHDIVTACHPHDPRPQPLVCNDVQRPTQLKLGSSGTTSSVDASPHAILAMIQHRLDTLSGSTTSIPSSSSSSSARNDAAVTSLPMSASSTSTDVACTSDSRSNESKWNPATWSPSTLDTIQHQLDIFPGTTTASLSSAGVSTMASVPASSTVSTSRSVSFASGCFNCHAETASFRCKRCQTARYCNATCQRAHWPNHKLVCSSLASSSFPSSSS
jgi:MYND finger